MARKLVLGIKKNDGATINKARSPPREMEREARRGTRNFRKLSLPLGKKQKVSGNKYLGDPRASIFPAPREGATQKEREVKPLQSLQRTEPDTDQEKPVVGLKLAYIDPQVQSPAPHKPGMVENACNPNT